MRNKGCSVDSDFAKKGLSIGFVLVAEDMGFECTGGEEGRIRDKEVERLVPDGVWIVGFGRCAEYLVIKLELHERAT